MSEPESIAKSYFVVVGVTGERKYYDDYRQQLEAIEDSVVVEIKSPAPEIGAFFAKRK